jgi:hypothetical protein
MGSLASPFKMKATCSSQLPNNKPCKTSLWSKKSSISIWFLHRLFFLPWWWHACVTAKSPITFDGLYSIIAVCVQRCRLRAGTQADVQRYQESSLVKKAESALRTCAAIWCTFGSVRTLLLSNFVYSVSTWRLMEMVHWSSGSELILKPASIG